MPRKLLLVTRLAFWSAVALQYACQEWRRIATYNIDFICYMFMSNGQPYPSHAISQADAKPIDPNKSQTHSNVILPWRTAYYLLFITDTTHSLLLTTYSLLLTTDY